MAAILTRRGRPRCSQRTVVQALYRRPHSRALNLFGFRANPWTTESETIGAVLAAHAAAAVLTSQHDQQMQAALSTRDRIGQAKGIIMERYDVDDIAAFDMLRRLSQETNIKLTDIAQQVISTRNT